MPSATCEALLFLELVFTGKPDNLFLFLQVADDNQSYWLANLAPAAALANLAEQDVHVSTGLASRDYCDAGRCPPEEISGIVGICVDIELRSDAKRTLPRSLDDAISVFSPELPPTCVVDSGGGVQACWLFQELYIFENDEDRKQAAGLIQRWNSLVRDNGRMRGWALDRVADVAHLLRVAGTMNCKDPDNPKPVTIVSRTDHRYTPSQLVEYLDDMEVPDQEAAEARKKFGGRDEEPLTINLAARMPDDLLNQWLATDPVFKSTWFRQRSDFPDHSQSQYDLALASFGASAGLGEQQIIDLIIQHRVMHKQKVRSRLDYYYRLLAKTSDEGDAGKSQGTGAGQARESNPHGPQPEAPGSATSAPNPERAKMALCDELSGDFGVEVLRIVKLSGQDPAYRIELAEGQAHFGNVGKFISQAAVRSAIAARVGKLIPNFKPKKWRRIVQRMLDACIVEDGGAELEADGAALMYLSQYLEENTFISSIAGQVAANKRKPMVYGGRITVCSSDLQIFINIATHQNLSVIAIAAMLSAIGAKWFRMRGKGFREQGRWKLPVSEFDPADYAVQESDLQAHG